jgi:hypothetical protein
MPPHYWVHGTLDVHPISNKIESTVTVSPISKQYVSLLEYRQKFSTHWGVVAIFKWCLSIWVIQNQFTWIYYWSWMSIPYIIKSNPLSQYVSLLEYRQNFSTHWGVVVISEWCLSDNNWVVHNHFTWIYYWC